MSLDGPSTASLKANADGSDPSTSVVSRRLPRYGAFGLQTPLGGISHRVVNGRYSPEGSLRNGQRLASTPGVSANGPHRQAGPVVQGAPSARGRGPPPLSPA